MENIVSKQTQEDWGESVVEQQMNLIRAYVDLIPWGHNIQIVTKINKHLMPMNNA
jgi:hypothetical protein